MDSKCSHRFGLVSVSFRGNSPREIVDAVSGCGLSLIEWGGDVHAKCSDTGGLSELRNLCDENHIGISSYGTYFFIGKTPDHMLLPHIEAAKLLGTDILRLWCGQKSYSEYSNSEFCDLVLLCKKYAAIAEEHGVKLCMECHNGTVTDCPEGALRLMQEVGSPAFRMYWQPNQFRSFADNLEYARLIAPYTEIIHVFNWEGDLKFPLSEGVDKWKSYLVFFDDSIPILLEFMPDGRIDSLPQEADGLYSIFRG